MRVPEALDLHRCETSFDRFRNKIPDEVLVDLLDFLGITWCHDRYHGYTFDLKICTNDGRVEEKGAILDVKSGAWRIKSLPNPKHLTTSSDQFHATPPPTPYSPKLLWGGADVVESSLLSPDWYHLLPTVGHGKLFRDTDWSATEFGPVSQWPLTLRLYTNLVLSDPRPAIIYWGESKSVIYNEQILPNIGQAHPKLFGNTFNSCFSLIWETFVPIFEQLFETGVGITFDEYPLRLERHGFLEETHWQSSMIPLRDDTGKYVGAYAAWVEVTQQVVGERRRTIVEEIGNFPHHDPKIVWEHITGVLDQHPLDVPIAVLYSTMNPMADNGHILALQGQIGLPTSPKSVDLDNDETVLGIILRKARQARAEWTLGELTDECLQSEFLEGMKWTDHDDEMRQLVVIPINVVNGIEQGYIIIGINPRMPFDISYQTFISNISRQLITLFTRLTTHEQANLRGEQLMQELQERERRIRRLTQITPMGIFEVRVDLTFIYANDHFSEITGIPNMKDDHSNVAWEDYVHEDDHSRVKHTLRTLLAEKKEISESVRLTRTWNPPGGPEGGEHTPEPQWIMFRMFPDLENGEVKSIVGCLIDISQIKWAESLQARRVEEARMEKKRKEDFIDITSHEIRNPLTAIAQCGEAISTSLDDVEPASTFEDLLAIIRSNVEAADSILLCARHQKTIIDDILTLSKLDSSILSITPVPFRPSSIITETLAMFKAEFAASDISILLQNDLSPPEIVNGDPSRILQIFMNLLTNAIKFTRAEAVRQITIKASLSALPPLAEQFGPSFIFCPTAQGRRDLSQDSEYGKGEIVYLSFAVEDTGKGIASSKAVELFDKFTQASRRTHIKYGGSGLGLFISRELTELQGGYIGVGSEEDVGSTFAFYIKMRRVEVVPPVPHLLDIKTRRPSRDETEVASRATLADDSVFHVPDFPEIASDQSNLQKPKDVNPNYTILLVEDNLVNQMVLAKQLRKAGCTVAVANHGGEAIDFLLSMYGQKTEADGTMTNGHQGTSVDRNSRSLTLAASPGPVVSENPVVTDLTCVLMDWEMPVVDGLAATKRIRELEQTGAIKKRQYIMGVTANVRSEQIQMAKGSGMDDVVSKPFRVSELLAKIRSMPAKN